MRSESDDPIICFFFFFSLVNYRLIVLLFAFLAISSVPLHLFLWLCGAAPMDYWKTWLLFFSVSAFCLTPIRRALRVYDLRHCAMKHHIQMQQRHVSFSLHHFNLSLYFFFPFLSALLIHVGVRFVLRFFLFFFFCPKFCFLMIRIIVFSSFLYEYPLF